MKDIELETGEILPPHCGKGDSDLLRKVALERPSCLKMQLQVLLLKILN